MSVLWMCSGLAYYFFFSFEPSAPNYSLPYNFYDSKICFSSCRERGTKKTLFFHEDSGFFSLSHSQDKIKKVFCFSFTDLENYNDIFLSNPGFKSRTRLNFFQALLLLFFITAMITFIHVFIRSSNI